jgi:uncharacterized phosphosugar-binding protein
MVVAKNTMEEWSERARQLIGYIATSQSEQISEAAEATADSISHGHAVFLFGSGHSVMPVEEMFPRYGGLLGFLPVLELPLSFFTAVTGNMGFAQFDFLENSPEYGNRIISNYEIHSEDSMIVFTHSGSTPVTMEVALRFKERGGGKLIGVTSLTRSRNSKSKHPSGKAIHHIADTIIDTGVPDADVSIELNGLHAGPLSSIGALTAANMISLGTIFNLQKRGANPSVSPVRAFDPDADRRMEDIVAGYRQLYSSHIRRK